jgi:hypothetical protein
MKGNKLMKQSGRISQLLWFALFFLAVIFVPTMSHAACHTILQGGSGNKSGSDWNNAMAALPSSMVRGDTYYVGPGQYGSHSFSDPDSGTSTIQVRATTAADHCTDTGWSAATMIGQAVFSCSSACGNVLTFNTDYYVFNGQYRSTATGSPFTDWTLESGYGFKIDNSNSNAGAEVAGGNGYKQSTCNSLAACSTAGMFVHDITVEYLDINGAHTSSDSGDIDMAFDFEGGSYNLDFSRNYTHDAAIPYFLKGSHGNQAGGGYYFGTGDGNTVEYTYVQHNYSSPTYHSEGCSCSEGLTNFTWRYNVEDQIGGVGSNGSTALIATPSGADYNTGNGPNGPWFIYGNIFTCTTTVATNNCAVGDGVLAIWDATFSGTVYFLNNTLNNIGPHSDEGAFGIGLSQTTPMVSLVIQNNLYTTNNPMTVINNGTTSYSGATFSTPVTNSYNAYFNTSSGSGSDTSTTKQVISSNPFSGGTCCTLASDTNAGINTSSEVAGNNTDMLGVARGVNGTWDRGALQIPGSQTAPSPPSGLSAVVH